MKFLYFLFGVIKGQCGNTEFTEEIGEITSPGFPAQYGNNVQCEYNIRAPTGVTVSMECVY